jgi:hypothetical protein
MKRVAELENKLNHLHNIVQQQIDINKYLIKNDGQNQSSPQGR